MFSAISSYLFGDDATEVQVNAGAVFDTEDAVSDWILVDHVSFQGGTNGCEEHQHSDKKPAGKEMEESWYVTPPSCFGCQPKILPDGTSKLENLLIEHPSMSVYQPKMMKEQQDGASPEQSPDKTTLAVPPSGQPSRAGQGRIFLCQSQEKRIPLKDLGCNYAMPCESTKSRKGSRRSNQIHYRNVHGQHNKKLNRRAGKHVGMVGKRAK